MKNSFILSALKEIVFLVIGILIAVSINNWNQARKDRNVLQKILVTVSEDLKNDISEVEKVIEYLKMWTYTLIKFYKILSQDKIMKTILVSLC